MADTVFVADLEVSKILAAVLDRDGKVLSRRDESLDVSNPLSPVKQLLRIASDLGQGRTMYSAAGIAVRGTVRSDGTVSVPDLAEWEKVPLGRLLHSKLQIPVVVESAPNAAALGETWRGAGRGKKDVVVLTAGATIGAGIISGGHLLRGAHHLAGSAAWMVVCDADGFQVRKFGGLQAFASESAIVRAARNAAEAASAGVLAERHPEAFSADEIAELARRGNSACMQIFRRVGKLLGLAVANLISIFDPEVVVVGGSLVSASDLFWHDLTHTALARCHPVAARQLRIRVSGLGQDANLHGAGYLAWHSANQALSSSLAEDPRLSAKKVKRKVLAPRGEAVAR